jgi:putative FmdB family regulatory protein
MPTYSYRCPKDNTQSTYTRTIDDRDNPVECSACGGEMNREYLATPVHFKGTGFYSTGG